MADNIILKEIDDIELKKRVRILKQLRSSLLNQRQKFKNYLLLLEKEEEAIINDDIENLEEHIKIEHSIISEIFTFQKIIKPLEDLYEQAYPYKEDSIPKLKASLESMKQKVILRNERNRTLLKGKMESLRQEIKALKKNFSSQSPYSRIGEPSLVDIST